MGADFPHKVTTIDTVPFLACDQLAYMSVDLKDGGFRGSPEGGMWHARCECFRQQHLHVVA